MLSVYLNRFNNSLDKFNEKFPRPEWSDDFKDSLLNDYTFFSARIEDSKIQYGDSVKFLTGELVEKKTMKSLLHVHNHKHVLDSLIKRYESFKLSEQTIKDIHKDLMSSEHSWESGFKPHLIGEYRNYSVVGCREPFFQNKEYVFFKNLDMSMSSYMGMFLNKFENIDNSNSDTHLITALAYFHNKFLNTIHPFADGNGRVCRIIMGIILMKNNCPPIFTKIKSEEDQFEYISKIIECEDKSSDEPLIEFFADGMVEYMQKRISENTRNDN